MRKYNGCGSSRGIDIICSVCLLFQFQCPNCKAGFDKRSHYRPHVWACRWCETCKIHVDKRHFLICGKRERKGSRLYCRMCHKLRSKDGFRRHMKVVHGVEGWVRREHPDVLSEVGVVVIVVERSSEIRKSILVISGFSI